jgi:hypothetical protein
VLNQTFSTSCQFSDKGQTTSNDHQTVIHVVFDTECQVLQAIFEFPVYQYSGTLHQEESDISGAIESDAGIYDHNIHHHLARKQWFHQPFGDDMHRHLARKQWFHQPFGVVGILVQFTVTITNESHCVRLKVETLLESLTWIIPLAVLHDFKKDEAH